MKLREKRLIIVDRKIAEYKAHLMVEANKRLDDRREVEAKKLAAIRAEYFKQLHAAELAYKKSKVVEKFDSKLAAYRKKVMRAATIDNSASFRAKLQKKILIRLGAYRKSLSVLEQSKLKKYKQKMT
jgi:type IV secretory pathway TraG/TraD family ATPase VirD4